MKIRKTTLKKIIKEEVEKIISEKWKGDVEIEQTGEYADKTIEQLCDMKDKIVGKEPFTDKDKKRLSQINFAIRAKRDWRGGAEC